MYYTYILENPDGRLYIGQSDNVEKRLLRHNSNMVKSTKHKGSWKLIYSRAFAARSEAVACETYLKSLKSSKYIKSYIVGS